MKTQSLAAALFFGAALLWGVCVALYRDVEAALWLTPYALTAAALTAAALTAAALGPRLRQRAAESHILPGGLLDGAAVMGLAFYLGVVLLAAREAFTAERGDAFGTFIGALLLPAVGGPITLNLLIFAGIAGSLAGVAFRAAVARGAV